MKKYRLLIFAFLAFAAAVCFRFYRLDTTPAGLSVDEIANAYNAYSLIDSGRDEYGVFMPLFFRSFNDYKPPVTIYSLVPAIFFGGNDVFQVRFAPALLGCLTVLLVFYILLKLGFSKRAAFFASVWFAVVPWHVRLSRETLEAAEALFFTLLGVAGYLGWRKDKSGIAALAFGLGFGLSLWTYHAQKIFIPGLLAFLFFPLRHKLSEWKKPLLAFLVFLAPLLLLAVTNPEIFSRSNATSIVNDSGLKMQLSRAETPTAEIYAYLSYWGRRYLAYFDVRYLFWDGLNLTLPGRIDSGLFLVADILPIMMGAVYLVRRRPAWTGIWIFWLAFGVLPASITMDDRHVIRSLVWIFPFVLMFAMFIRENKSRIAAYAYILGGIVSLLLFRDLYFRKFNVEMGEYFSSGYRQIAKYACQHQGEYQHIYVSEAYGEVAQLTAVPQLYLGFYCRGRPEQYLDPENKISVKRPYWKEDINYSNSLFIAAPWDFPIANVPEKLIKDRIYFPNGKTAFVFVETAGESER